MPFDNVEYATASGYDVKTIRECASPSSYCPDQSDREGGDAVIQSIDRAAKVLSSLAGRSPPRHHRTRERARPAAVDRARHRQVAAAARPRREGAERQPLHARAGAAEAQQRLPRHARRARPRDALDARTRSPHRTLHPARRGALRRGHHHPPQPSARRHQQMLETGSPSRCTPRRWARCCSPTTRSPRRGPDRVRFRSLTAETITDPRPCSSSSPRSRNALGLPSRTRRSWASPRSRRPSSTRAARSSPRSRWSCPRARGRRPRTVLNDLREAARNISRELGAPTWPPRAPAAAAG